MHNFGHIDCDREILCNRLWRNAVSGCAFDGTLVFIIMANPMHTVTRLLGIGYLAICLIALVGRAFIGDIGYAPLALPIGPAQQPVVVTIWYGTEKREWLEEAVRRFAATNPRVGARPIQIVLHGIGSRELATRVARREFGSDGEPTVLSPASSLWVEVARTDWAALNAASPGLIADGVYAPTPLALTPMVVVVWEERARALWPNGPAKFWDYLHNALANPQGWVGVVESRKDQLSPEAYEQLMAASQNWGFVKFGHTSPLTSNSGAQALILMAYGYHNKSSGLTAADITDPGFRAWFNEIEGAVLEFGDSTGSFMDAMVNFGPSKYDVVMVYENTAIERLEAAQNRWGQGLRVYYPPATLFSDHPYAILDAPWVAPEQRDAARQFRDFLLSRPLQELALQAYGFRPADLNVPVASNDPNNPFVKYQGYGVQVDIAQQVQTPDGATINTLLDLWRRDVNR